jgi:cytoskeletal protein CcmA (bactofilin family)
MWKSNQAASTPNPLSADFLRRAGLPQVPEPSVLKAITGSDRSSIGKMLKFVGQITASEPLYIDGNVEGTINLPGHRVTVGQSGHVNATINAAEIVVLGTVVGNVSATEKVEIRAEGSLTGDISTIRIRIEEGAFFNGSLEVCRPVGGPELVADRYDDITEQPVVNFAASEARKRAMPHLLQSA